MNKLAALTLVLLVTQLNVQANIKSISDRKKDWKNNQIVYQIFIDRFYNGDPKNDKVGKKSFHKFHNWDDKPKHGKYLPKVGYWSHELEFWGGDLQGVIDKLDYIKSLGVNTLYLNPIFESITNHKYDTGDYFKIDPGFGTLNDLKKLAKAAHSKNIKIILDGVFNHMGFKSSWFQAAQKNPNGKFKDFFKFDNSYEHGYHSWYNVKNLPELQIDNLAVQEKIFSGQNSVVKKYLQYVDGLRLDVAHGLGLDILSKITKTCHQMKKDSIVIGEVWNYPDKWLTVLDGVMNFHLRELIFNTLNQKMSTKKFNFYVNKMVQDSGIENILKSWVILTNHDTPRLSTLLPDRKAQKLAVFLQYTLPGSPVLYYGEEIGMTGGADPEMRGPMEWKKVANKSNSFVQQMINIRSTNLEFQVGDYVSLESDHFVSFIRKADSIKDFAIILANVGDVTRNEVLAIPEYKLMNGSSLKNIFSSKKVTIKSGTITVSLKPKETVILKPFIPIGEYSDYKRVK